MFGKNASENWEKYGAEDPYYGVLSHDRYHMGALDNDAKRAFFESGSDYIDNVVNIITKYIDSGFSPENSLDFGCGVGRLLIPISKISNNTSGVDVSESMLKEARKNIEIFSADNITLIESDDCSDLLSETYDFVHSFIVFQHIPVKYGMAIFTNIMNSLKPGGIGVLHFTYSNPGLHGIKGGIKRYLPFMKPILRVFKREKLQPEMQMNEYELNRIYEKLAIHRVSVVYSEMTDHDGIKGICLYFKKGG